MDLRGGGAGWSEFPEQFQKARKGGEASEHKAEELGWPPTLKIKILFPKMTMAILISVIPPPQKNS